jgi:3'-phosphoadenosine 5'-phosphosulfate (PAPS) 3'-phosphatase
MSCHVTKVIREGVLDALRAASDIAWTEELLYHTVDKGTAFCLHHFSLTLTSFLSPSLTLSFSLTPGTFDGTAERVWVLDPVDGTKGFMRGEHYCIALALLSGGEKKMLGRQTARHSAVGRRMYCSILRCAVLQYSAEYLQKNTVRYSAVQNGIA